MNFFKISPQIISSLLLAFCLILASSAHAQEAEQAAISEQDINQILQTIEDDAKRAEFISTLKALSQANQQLNADANQPTVQTATAEMVGLIASKARDTSNAIGDLIGAMANIPQLAINWSTQLGDAEYRQKWITIGWRIIAVIGGGILGAFILGLMLKPLSNKISLMELNSPGYSKRVGLLTLKALYELAPIVALIVISYGILTLVDPRQETRLVAVALINASVFLRMLLLLSRFFLSPESSSLRLWSISSESAHYLMHWVKRIGYLAIYGFFILQAAYLLGMDGAIFEILLRFLGFIILLSLLVLIAQNRHEVSQIIAPAKNIAESDNNTLNVMRRGISRTWHWISSAYLVVIYAVWALRIENGSSYLIQASFLTVLILFIANLVSHVFAQIFHHGFGLSDEMKQRFPALEPRLNRYFPVIRRLGKITLIFATILFIGHAWGIETLLWITQGSGKVFLAATLHILLVLAIAFIVWEFASGSIENYLADKDIEGEIVQRSARTKTLLTVARNALLVVLSIMTLLMILSELGINIAPLLAGAGVAGLAIGFGAQKLVQDVINGAFILFQDLMSVGDFVKVGDTSGTVEALSIRTVRLRDVSGVVHTIPFSSIEGISNFTREFSYYLLDIGIAYRENVDEVVELIKAIGEELQQDEVNGPLMLEPVEVLGLNSFGDSAIIIRARLKTVPSKQWQVGRAYNRLMKIRFDENNIEIPFPHQTIYFGQDKDGSAPPAFFEMQSPKA